MYTLSLSYYFLCRNNNYTLVGDLLLDMPPEVGELNYKMITIEKNDNAEGVVEFSQEAANFIGE